MDTETAVVEDEPEPETISEETESDVDQEENSLEPDLSNFHGRQTNMVTQYNVNNFTTKPTVLKGVPLER